MGVNRRVIEGSSASQNPLPERVRNPKVTLQGLFRNQRASFSLDESILSKHTLFVGGTGCGKTTLFYHFVNQLRQSMTSNDVMVIFDSKGDFYSKFFKQGDFVIGNSSQYQKQSQRWNLFKEILADGWDEGTYELNIQEICRSLFEEKVKQNSANAFFPNAARDLLASIIECLIRAGVQDRNVRQQLFFNDELRKLLDGCDIDKILEILSDYSDMNGVKSYIEDRGGQAMGVLAEMFSAVRDLFIGVFSGHGFFSMREFIRSKEELYQLATMLSKKTRRKKSVELSGWEAPEPIKETQSKCWSCDDAEKIIPKLLLGQIQIELYFLFEGLLQDSENNIQKKINGQSRHRI